MQINAIQATILSLMEMMMGADHIVEVIMDEDHVVVLLL